MKTVALVPVLVCFVFSACNGATVGRGRPGSAGGGPSQGGDGGSGGNGNNEGGGGGGGMGASGGSGGGGAVEPCPDVGANRSCPPNSCRQGTQICLGGDATVSGGTWGPCTDIKLIPGCQAPDAGVVDASCNCAAPTPACESYCQSRQPPDASRDVPPLPPGAECPPNQARLCHTDPLCDWGVQACSAQGQWGACGLPGCPKETHPFDFHCPANNPDCCYPTDVGGSFDFCTCVESGHYCCADDLDEGRLGGQYSGSAGACAPGIQITWPPKSTCSGKGYCVPGKERWCASGPPSPIPGSGFIHSQWGRETCQEDGSWGPCVDSAPPAGPAGVCKMDPGDFFVVKDNVNNSGSLQDRASLSYRECCIQAGICCKRYSVMKTCPASPEKQDAYSYGACDGISCL